MDRIRKEVVRYLGYGRNAVDAQTLALIEDSLQELQSAVCPKHTYRIFDLRKTDAAHFLIGKLELKSKSLDRNLSGCDRLVLFGATLGIGADRLIARASLTDMARAVVFQACGAALLEEYCDECQAAIGKELQKEGRYLRPRFSPGYGDFSIEYQRDILRLLDCAKTIGLTMTDSLMLSPSKSVTAVIGASLSDESCHRHGCESCEKKDCRYRRDEG